MAFVFQTAGRSRFTLAQFLKNVVEIKITQLKQKIPIFFSWIALGTVELHVSVILVKKATAVKGGTTSATWLYHQHNQSIHMTDGVTVMSLSASPPTLDKSSHGLCMPHHVKPKSTAFFQCQITLKWNWAKINVKWDLPIFFHGFSQLVWPYSAIVSAIDKCLIVCNHSAI